MIEVIVKEEKTVEKIDFPVLMKGKEFGTVVLFTDENSGVCLEKGTSNNWVGLNIGGWLSCFDTEFWEKYEGEITLKNK